MGCPLKCTFCYSGTVPFARNLTVGEILGQFGAITKELLATTTRVNVVFMGMGELAADLESDSAMGREPKKIAAKRLRQGGPLHAGEMGDTHAVRRKPSRLA